MTPTNLTEALNLFEQSAILHKKYSDEGESGRKINTCYNKIIQALKWLHNNDKLSELKKFYTHENLGVRCWAASYLLEIDTKGAEEVLEDIISLEKKTKFFNAKYVLMEWRNGNIKMYFGED